MKILFLTILLTFNVSAAEIVWGLDKSHSIIKFDIDHLVVSEVSGKFDDVKSDIKSDKLDFTDAIFNIVLETKSINTNDSKRDEHLRSSEFFDAEKFPQIMFVGKKFEKLKNGKYKIYGILDMHGVKKEVVFNGIFGGIIKDPWGGIRAGLKFQGEVDRYDYGLKYNSVLEAGGLAIGQKVRIAGNLELIKVVTSKGLH
ncbi:YceI family protein [Bacteriovorax sp. PP10]|uniref:YceI family protein n=1 Tax=Bacteriovorax antarcticus TaxID=3088717 RepID=A0ABU5VSR0_9BACT|nr:YceI family protein [Bacteriovorax sp. PP10]MEA9355962.1 YceI family protein [Bacteriovorax sp. PP10]